MVVTLEGTEMEVREEHLVKVPTSTVVMPPGILTDLKLVHSQNASRSIEVTLSGITTDVREVQLEKAHSPIEVIVEGRVMAGNALH